MSATSTLKDLTEAYVGPMVSGYTIALEGERVCVTKVTVTYDRERFAIYLRSCI